MKTNQPISYELVFAENLKPGDSLVHWQISSIKYIYLVVGVVSEPCSIILTMLHPRHRDPFEIRKVARDHRFNRVIR